MAGGRLDRTGGGIAVARAPAAASVWEGTRGCRHRPGIRRVRIARSCVGIRVPAPRHRRVPGVGRPGRRRRPRRREAPSVGGGRASGLIVRNVGWAQVVGARHPRWRYRTVQALTWADVCLLLLGAAQIGQPAKILARGQRRPIPGLGAAALAPASGLAAPLGRVAGLVAVRVLHSRSSRADPSPPLTLPAGAPLLNRSDPPSPAGPPG